MNALVILILLCVPGILAAFAGVLFRVSGFFCKLIFFGAIFAGLAALTASPLLLWQLAHILSTR